MQRPGASVHLKKKQKKQKDKTISYTYPQNYFLLPLKTNFCAHLLQRPGVHLLKKLNTLFIQKLRLAHLTHLPPSTRRRNFLYFLEKAFALVRKKQIFQTKIISYNYRKSKEFLTLALFSDFREKERHFRCDLNTAEIECYFLFKQNLKGFLTN